MAIEYFCCYHSYRMKIAKLSDQEGGRRGRSLLEYSETGETQELTGREAVAFDFIAYDIEQSKKAYAERCRTNAENGKTGGRPKKRELSEKPNGFSETQKSQTKTKTKTETNPPNGGEKRLSRFRPPTREEIAAYCAERGNNLDAGRIFDHYESNGWMVGKNKMRDWKAAVRGWEGREQQFSTKRETANERYSRELQELIASGSETGGGDFEPW